MSVWVVRCGDCTASGSNRGRVWRESCQDCGETTAAAHLEAFPGHHVTIAEHIELSRELSRRTQKLIGKQRRYGW